MKLIGISLLILPLISTPVTATDDVIFVTDLGNSTIWTGPIETLDLVKIPLQNIGVPVAVDFDPIEQRVYWTDVRSKSISRSFLDGSAQETLLSYLEVPDGIALDVKNRHMYWTDTGTDKIERANLDGSGRITIVQEHLDQPRAIVIDSTNERLFWTDWGANPRIERANLDGSERVTLVNTSLHSPNGIVIDYAAQRLYWCDAGHNKIETSDVNGEDRKQVVSISAPDIHPFDLGVYNDVIYWSDWALPKLVQMNKYLGGAEVVGPAVFARAGGLHIYSAATGRCNENPCLNGGQCSDEVNHLLCDCQSTGYEGPTCEADTNECEQTFTVCDENADCTNTIGSFTCDCTAGYFGDGNTCMIEVNECGPNNPCQNDGECTNKINGFDCTCVVGYTGERCEIVVDICASSQCRNGGTCIDLVYSFECKCEAGYEGDTCESMTSTGCYHPGNLENGYVIPEKSSDIYSPGKKVEFVCEDGYKLQGSTESICLSDLFWSSENPVCIQKNGGEDRIVVAVGGGVLFLALIIILVGICLKKRRRPAHANNLPNIAVQYRNNPQPVPKDDGLYNTAYDAASSPYMTHIPAPLPFHAQATPPSQGAFEPVYDGLNISNLNNEVPRGVYDIPRRGPAVAERYPGENPPPYSGIINPQPNGTSPSSTDNDYILMEKNNRQ